MHNVHLHMKHILFNKLVTHNQLIQRYGDIFANPLICEIFVLHKFMISKRYHRLQSSQMLHWYLIFLYYISKLRNTQHIHIVRNETCTV